MRSCFQQHEVLFLAGQQPCLLEGFNGLLALGLLITGQVVRGIWSPVHEVSPVCAVRSRLTIRGCRCYTRPDRTWQAQTAALHVCGRPHARVCRAVCCPWRKRYWSNQLGDHGAETSPTMWHPEPYGFEIIGKEWKTNKKKESLHWCPADCTSGWLWVLHCIRLSDW